MSDVVTGNASTGQSSSSSSGSTKFEIKDSDYLVDFTEEDEKALIAAEKRLEEKKAEADRVYRNAVMEIDENCSKRSITSTSDGSGTFEILVKSHHDAIQGFYYDQQLLNPALRMSLHPSRVLVKGSRTEWTDPEEVDKDSGGSKINYGSSDGEKVYYATKPIATAIINEDFQIGIANRWDESQGLADLEGLFNSAKTMAPFLGRIGEAASSAAETGREKIEEDKAEGKATSWSEGLEELMEWLALNSKKLEGITNRALVAQGSRFSYYNGTGVAFNNLNMKYTIFSDWKWDEDSKMYKFKSCYEQLSELVPYVMGAYVSLEHDIDREGMGEKTGKIFDRFNEFCGWQLPPGDFQASLKNLDTKQKGTLKLRFGTLYSIPNLVIADCALTFSRQMVKAPKLDGSYHLEVFPLYCDVQLTLKPAARYTGEALLAAVDGSDMKAEKLKYEQTINERLEGLAGGA